MSERKHADVWKKLVDEAGDDEIDRAASVSVERAEADLKAAGFDVAAERAKANASLDALDGGAPARPPAAVAPRETPRIAGEERRSRPRPSFSWLAAAAMVGGVVGGSLVAELRLASVGLPHASTADHLVVATDLRRQAATACDAKRWSLCLADLDRARTADPRGDDAPAVKSLRDKAIAGIVQEPEAPPP